MFSGCFWLVLSVVVLATPFGKENFLVEGLMLLEFKPATSFVVVFSLFNGFV